MQVLAMDACQKKTRPYGEHHTCYFLAGMRTAHGLWYQKSQPTCQVNGLAQEFHYRGRSYEQSFIEK
jgi:hypothetical protein